MLRRHWSYLKYLIRHKWFVYVAGRKIGCPIWRLLIHDMSKFRPSEWNPYATTFYDKEGNTRYKPTVDFNKAWLLHQHRNPHHWQYWLLKLDSGDHKTISIPYDYVLEMVADWAGAGKAITGEWEVKSWYEKNKEIIKLHKSTKSKVIKILNTHFTGKV